jgi:hypothetical protein
MDILPDYRKRADGSTRLGDEGDKKDPRGTSTSRAFRTNSLARGTLRVRTPESFDDNRALLLRTTIRSNIKTMPQRATLILGRCFFGHQYESTKVALKTHS